MRAAYITLIVCALWLETSCSSGQKGAAAGGDGAAGAAGSSGAAGASGSDGADGIASLTRVVARPPSNGCVQGGIAVEVGVDGNGNHQLDDDEVTSSQDVCNGPTISDQLTVSTTVPAEQATCTGELLIQVGQDNGSNGGTANDGVLQDGEVQTSWYVCPATPQFHSDITPPLGPAGFYTINASAGRTNANPVDVADVSGGTISLRIPQSSGGGHVKVFATGDAGSAGSQEAVWAFPTPPSANLGAHAVTLSGAVTIAALAAGAISPATPGYFTISNEQPQPGQLYHMVGSALTAVTGLTIAANAHVSVAENDVTTHVAHLRVAGDIVNAGEILPTTPSTTKLQLGCSTYNGALGSTITSHSRAVTIQAVGSIYNLGAIDTTGNPGTTDFNGGAVKLVSLFGDVFNSGAINSSGGENTNAGVVTSGRGGDITLEGARGVYNSGALSANGADVHTKSFGGPGGNVALLVRGQENNAGPAAGPSALRNTGAIQAKGGPCSASKCQGGVGGSIVLQNQAGATTAIPGFVAIASAALLSAKGGSVNGNQDESRGGSGGTVQILSTSQGSGGVLGNVKTVAGSIYLSGNLSTEGGDGDADSLGNAATPTRGGDIDITVVSEVHAGQEIVLLGYDSISTNGGACANTAGLTCGNGGAVALLTGSRGGIVNYAEINAVGGAAVADSTTGRGGTVTMSAGEGALPNEVSEAEFVINHGDFSLRGGNAAQTIGGGSITGSNAGYGGRFSLIGAAKVENFGTLRIDQGLSETPLSAPTSDPLYFSLLSSGGGPVVNAGEISGNGGQAASGDAGTGQRILLIGQSVQNTGAISMKGGSYEVFLSTVGAGGGGAIHLMSTNGLTSNADVSLLSAKAGVGGSASSGKHAADGIVSIDGVTLAQ